MKLLHEYDTFHCPTARYKASAKNSPISPCSFAQRNSWLTLNILLLAISITFVSYRPHSTLIFSIYLSIYYIIYNRYCIYYLYPFIFQLFPFISCNFKIPSILAFPPPSFFPSVCFLISMHEFCLFRQNNSALMQRNYAFKSIHEQSLSFDN